MDTSTRYPSDSVHWRNFFGHLNAISKRLCPLAPLLWTPRRDIQATLSIGATSLDTSTRYPSDSVHWRHFFGHLDAISKRLCPLAPLLWTPRRDIQATLSIGATSLDTSTCYPSDSVHWRRFFGHLDAISKRLCPLAPLLWTPRRDIQAFLSIGATSLDTSTRYPSDPVHWRHFFGRLNAIFKRPRPLAPLLWTPQRDIQATLSIGATSLDTSTRYPSDSVHWRHFFGRLNAIFKRPRPLAPLLWTPRRDIQATLSIGATSLDTSTRYPSDSVHWRRFFGHLDVLSKRPCPLAALLWTPRRDIQATLSISGASLDTSTCYPSDPVHWRRFFGHLDAISKRPCPLAALLWTPRRAIQATLSIGATSLDTSTRYPSDSVQWHFLFGLLIRGRKILPIYFTICCFGIISFKN